MATQQSLNLVLDDVFTCKTLREKQLVSTLMFPGSRNAILIK